MNVGHRWCKANPKGKIPCWQAATNMVDRDSGLLLRITYKPYPNGITFTKLGYSMFSHIQLYVVLSLTKRYSAIHVKIFQMTLQFIVLWDDCHSEQCQVL